MLRGLDHPLHVASGEGLVSLALCVVYLGFCWLMGLMLILWMCWLLGSGDCGTNLLFVGECVRVVMLPGCMSRSGLVIDGV